MRKHWNSRWALAIGTGAALIALMAPTARAADPPAQKTWLGVYSQELTTGLRDGLDYTGKGVLVSGVFPDSPADRAGLRKGDVLLSFNSRTVTTPTELANMVRAMKPGQTASLGVVRDGARRTLSAKLAERSESDETAMPRMEMNDDDRDSRDPAEDDSEHGSPRAHVFKFKTGPEGVGRDMMRMMGRGRLGVRIESLSPDLGGYFGVPDGRGALVIEVLKGTPAERAGIKAGDVITRVGGENVYDAEDLTGAVNKQEGRVSLSVVRKTQRLTIEANLEGSPRTMRWTDIDGPMGMNGDDKVVIRRFGDGGDDSDVREQVKQLREELRSLREEMRKQRR